MLRAKVLPEVLGQIVGDGVTACMCVLRVSHLHLLRLPSTMRPLPASRSLMTLEGALMGAVGDEEAVDHKVVGAIASHTWGEYLHAGKEANPTGELRTMLVELEVH
ncbi:hypothetical protein BBJ28_00013342 [Nothophytophthora sp. Chile5]|nr:hypothetical protein BBJ28_00013342 [Nothophytophthora sp. Chile5]